MKKTLGAMAFALVLLATLPLHAAHASLGACNGDPKVTLNDLGHTVTVQIDLTTDIADAAANVTAVTYELYVPSWVASWSILYDSGPLQSKEVVHIHTTNLDHHYDAAVKASTLGAAQTVTSTETLTYNGAQTQSRATGLENAWVDTYITA